MELVLCPHCNAKIKHDGSHAGRVVSCPRCRGQLQLPMVPTAASPMESSPFDFDGTPAATTPKLIRCKACGNPIGTHALSCPRCGQMNDWTHPEIQRFIDNIDRIKLPQNYRYIANRDKLDIEATPPSRAARWMLLGVAFLLMSVPCGGAAVMWFPPPASTLAFGFFMLFAPLGCFSIAFLKGLTATMVTRCTVDFSENPPRWSADNPEAWRSLKRFFGL